MEYRVDGRAYCLAAGDMAVLTRWEGETCFPTGHYHGVTVTLDPTRAPDCLSCFLEDVDVRPQALMDRYCREGGCFVARSSPRVEHIFSELYTVPEGIRRGYLSVKLLELLLALSVWEGEPRPGGTPAQTRLVGEAEALLQDRPEERWTLARLSQRLGASPSLLQGSFRAVYSMSPGAFLRAISRHKTGADGGDDPAFALYQEKLEGKLDFDDLLLETLRQWEGGRSDRRFTHLLVDEFQDIDRLQLRLLRAWRREGGTFFAIGDPDQSIYGFRGADAGCFSALGAERTVRLTENYRSTPEILAAALPVTEAIDGAPRRMETHSPHGAEVRLLTAEGDRAEAIFVAKEIARMVGGIGMLEAQALGAARGARSFGDIAVLYRTRRQAALLEECLAHDGIPCVVTGREDFLLDGEVQAALAWLEGQQEEGKSPAALLEEWTAHHTPSGGVERLRNMAVFFGDVPAFLRNLTIGQEGDLLRRAGLSYAAGAVTLSTLHGAKGLEWPVVFLCGVGEGRIPLERKGLDTDEAEERRLLYVGMTRAREELVLLSGGEPSRFLAGLPLRQDPAHAPVPRPLGVQLSLFK